MPHKWGLTGTWHDDDDGHSRLEGVLVVAVSLALIVACVGFVVLMVGAMVRAR